MKERVTDDMNGSYETSKQTALTAHQGQTDKAGAPYILHPLRVMVRMDSEEAMMAAVLHDVVEDTDIGLDDLRGMGIPEAVLAAVEHPTRRAGESYDAFIQRVRKDNLARRVKLVDLEDNLDLKRIACPTGKDLARMEKYRRARRALVGNIGESQDE